MLLTVAATVSSTAATVSLFRKRALQKRLYSAKKTYTFKEPTNRSHPTARSRDDETLNGHRNERWGAGVETQKNLRGEIGGWGRVPFNEPYAPSVSTIYDGA